MNVLGIANIGDDCHADIRKALGCMELSLAQLSPLGTIGIIVGIEGRELHTQEWEFTLAPTSTPVFNHGGKEGAIFKAFAAVTFALVPNHAAKCIRDQWMNHAVVKSARVGA